MIQVHSTLLSRLRDSATDPTIERKPADFVELYAHDYIPDAVNGFEPADAVEQFALIDITHDGIAYRRNVVSRGSIDKSVGQQTNTVSITFSNVDSFMATFAQVNEIEGMWVVIRYVERDITAGSLVLFVGKSGKPSTINNKSFSLTASQDLVDLNAELPLRTFTAQDPEGRAPSDPLYEGVRFTAVTGSHQVPQIIPAQNTLARLFGQRDTIYTTKQWSSLDATPYGHPIREALGRVQLELRPFLWADKGVQIAGLWEACAGPVQDIVNIKTRTQGWSDLVNSFEVPPDPVEIHLGDLGGTGTNAADPIGWPGAGFFSHLAYASGSSIGSTVEQSDTPPSVTAIIIGRRVPTPNGSGVYPSIAVESTLQWTDNPVHLARWIFIVSGASENMIEDAVGYLTSLWCDEPLLDESNSDRTLIMTADMAQTGSGVVRLISSGRINPRFVRYWAGDVGIEPPWEEEPTYEPLDPNNIPTNFTIERFYRKRYTFNAPIVERVKSIDFLYKVVYPCFRGYHTINSKGKIEIKTEKAADNCLLRSGLVRATGSITFTGSPNIGDTITIGGKTYTFTDEGEFEDEVALQNGALSTGERLAFLINQDTAITLCTSTTPVSGPPFTLTLTPNTPGVSGNSITLTESAANLTVSAFAGGVGSTTALQVDDVTPWKENLLLQGKLLIGGTIGLTTSEVRRVSTATFSADGNAITLTAAKTGSVTATASAGTLTGGSTTVQASGTVTIGGTPTASDTVTVTINGVAVVYTVAADETTTSCAAMIAYAINADTRLKRFIRATSAAAVVTIQAKYGVLNLDAALVNAHTGPRAAPVAGPTLAASAGTMAAGTYLVAYAYVTAIGRTTVGPTSAIVLTANQKIDITSLGALPGDVTSVNWYVSEPGLDKLTFYDNNAGGAFSITELPSRDNPGAPAHNTTAEECIRVALSFATNTQGATILAQAGLTRGNANDYNYPLGSEQSSINQIKGNFRDAKNDFALTPFVVNDPLHQLRLGSGGNKKIKPLEVDYSGVDNWHQAFRLANAAISKNREGDWFNSLSTGTGEALLLEEGDLITASDASGGLVNVVSRIEALSISPTWEVSIRKARKYSTLMFSDDVRQHEIPLPSTLKYVQTADTQFVPMDIPYWRDTDSINQLGFHLAPNRSLDGDWRGTTIYSDASGAYVAITGKLETQVPIGDALTAMTATTNTHTIDTVSTVRIQIVTPFGAAPLVSTTESLMKAGANKYALGVNGRWEIGHFQTATLVGGTDDTWDLTVHLRGRYGTEHNTSNHTTADEFVLLTDAEGNDTGVVFIPLDYSLLAKTFNLKAVTTNQDVADATAESFTWEGEIMRPLSIINERGTRDSVGSLLIEFEGRTRFGGGLRSFQGGAVNEEMEEYRVDIRSADGLTSKRVMPVIVGMAQTALLVNLSSQGGDKFDFIDQHSVFVTGSDISTTSRAVQVVERPGNFVEATLVATGEGSAVLRFADKASGTNRYTIFAAAGLAGGVSVQINDGTYQFVADYVSGEEVRVRITLSGAEVRFYLNYTGAGTPPGFVSRIAPVFPLVVEAVAGTGSSGGGGGSARVKQVIMTTIPFPKTVYSEQQQIEDFGSAQSSVVMDIWQMSKTLGDGTKKAVTL